MQFNQADTTPFGNRQLAEAISSSWNSKIADKILAGENIQKDMENILGYTTPVKTMLQTIQ